MDFPDRIYTSGFKTEYLDHCDHPEKLEYYLCGPPYIIQAGLKVLNELKVNNEQITYDEIK